MEADGAAFATPCEDEVEAFLALLRQQWLAGPLSCFLHHANYAADRVIWGLTACDLFQLWRLQLYRATGERLRALLMIR
ncbi:hypothetical protein B5E41_26815 [Rhizobium esperanzae]|uniref:Uncharacterized protein n=1 Tax=Rhizobium esperanzae TaxID=1967781 RepID=A0A246DMQ4_9HYPH|nr:hypothetical protein B5E41_26815 [Rhizobium esperanzae]